MVKGGGFHSTRRVDGPLPRRGDGRHSQLMEFGGPEPSHPLCRVEHTEWMDLATCQRSRSSAQGQRVGSVSARLAMDAIANSGDVAHLASLVVRAGGAVQGGGRSRCVDRSVIGSGGLTATRAVSPCPEPRSRGNGGRPGQRSRGWARGARGPPRAVRLVKEWRGVDGAVEAARPGGQPAVFLRLRLMQPAFTWSTARRRRMPPVEWGGRIPLRGRSSPEPAGAPHRVGRADGHP